MRHESNRMRKELKEIKKIKAEETSMNTGSPKAKKTKGICKLNSTHVPLSNVFLRA